jgi:hypothetical protein
LFFSVVTSFAIYKLKSKKWVTAIFRACKGTLSIWFLQVIGEYFLLLGQNICVERGVSGFLRFSVIRILWLLWRRRFGCRLGGCVSMGDAG